MRTRSLLAHHQREFAVTLFDQGFGYTAVANQLNVSRDRVRMLYHRWKIHGRLCLVEKPTKTEYSFEIKKEVVTRCLAGEPKIVLAQEYRLSSPQLIAAWLRRYWEAGDEGLRPKPKGRPKGSPTPRSLTEEEKLRRQVARLEAENAYLKKLRDLRDQGLR